MQKKLFLELSKGLTLLLLIIFVACSKDKQQILPQKGDNQEAKLTFTGKPPVVKPSADFIFKNDKPNVLIVDFFDKSTGEESYSWDFGDGSTSTERNPTHTYKTLGTFNVVLTVETVFGTTLSKTKKIVLIDEPPTILGPITYTIDYSGLHFICPPTTRTVGWLWSFGNEVSSTLQNPIYYYSTPAGSYIITLTVKSIGGKTATTSLIVNPPNYVVRFTADLIGHRSDQTFQFHNNSTGAETYLWDFGDGTTSTEINPIHHYTDGHFAHIAILYGFRGGKAYLTREQAF